jgi:hypothetical protein
MWSYSFGWLQSALAGRFGRMIEAKITKARFFKPMLLLATNSLLGRGLGYELKLNLVRK